MRRLGRRKSRPLRLGRNYSRSKSPPCPAKSAGQGWGILNLDTQNHLADFFAPLLQILFHLGHELVSDGSVDEAVIVAQREVNYGADGDGVVAVPVGDYHGLLGDSTYAHDGGVGLVDDGQAEDGAELAGVGDGKSGAFDVFGLELLGAGTLAEIGDAALQAEEIQVAGVLEDGDDESPIQGDSDAHVDVAMVADIVAFDVGVEDGPLLQGDDGGADEEGHEGQAGPMALLKSGLELSAQVHDAGEVHFVH